LAISPVGAVAVSPLATVTTKPGNLGEGESTPIEAAVIRTTPFQMEKLEIEFAETAGLTRISVGRETIGYAAVVVALSPNPIRS